MAIITGDPRSIGFSISFVSELYTKWIVVCLIVVSIFALIAFSRF